MQQAHKHIFATVLAVGLAFFFGLVVYPQVAFNQGEKGVPDVPTSLSGSAAVESIDLTWSAPETIGDGPVLGYNVYYSDDGARSFSSVDTESSETSYSLTGLTADVSYTIVVTAYNVTGESNDSSSIEETPLSASDPLAISSGPSATPSSTSVVVTWSTNNASSSLVNYGLLSDFYTHTDETDTSPLVTDHSVTISGLASCTAYWFQVYSNDAADSTVTSDGDEVKTTGCKGDSTMVTVDTRKVTTSTGATVEIDGSGRGITASAPAALKSDANLAISAARLEKEKVLGAISTPSGKTAAGDRVYSLTAYQNNAQKYEGSFDKSVTVSIEYTSEDIAGLDPETIKIYHYDDGSGWSELSNCSNDYDAGAGAGTVTCEADSFSIFGLFGEEPSESSGSSTVSSGYAGDSSYAQNNNSLSEEVTSGTTQEVADSQMTTETASMEVAMTENNTDMMTDEAENEMPQSTNSLTMDLWYGLRDTEVEILQTLLNKFGFTLSEVGPGSPGNETTFFGPLTKAALIKFQETYSSQILAPYGISKGTGYFGPFSRKVINSLK